jgi:hypothetical protein
LPLLVKDDAPDCPLVGLGRARQGEQVGRVGSVEVEDAQLPPLVAGNGRVAVARQVDAPHDMVVREGEDLGAADRVPDLAAR